MILLLIIVLGLAAYIGILSKKKSEDYAVEIGLENSEGNPTYIGLDGSVQAVYQEGNLINIVIQGSGDAILPWD